MPKAKSIPTTTRRTLFASSAAVVMASTAAATAPAIASDDAELLALRPRLEAALLEVSATEMSGSETLPPGRSNQDHEAWVARTGEELEEVCEAIVDAPAAATPEGRALKAAAAMHQLRFAYNGGWPGGGEALAWDVLSELAGDAYVPVALPEPLRVNCEPRRA
jgi:hypothetical protein